MKVQACSLVLFLSLCSVSYSVSTKKQYAIDNLNEMRSLRNLHGPLIRMDTEKFKKLVKTKSRYYSVVVMFTALQEKYKCQICKPAKKEFDSFGFSYDTAYPDSNELFFVIISAENANEAFQIMKLKYVPVIFLFPAKRKRTSRDKFDAMRTGYSAVGMAKWLHDVGDVKIKIIKPFDFTVVFFVCSALFPFIVIWLKFRNECMQLASNKTLWGLIVVTVVLTMTSGQMWNHIRKPPDANPNGRNGIEYINGSRGAQYLFESYIVMGVNGAIAIGFILLNEVHRFKGKVPRKIVGFLGFLVVAIFFGLLLHLFRMKSQGYPYSFLFL